ncbi:peptide methionine sulfoxide reductase [Sediminicola sp. YIK13]|uniref:peptide-methionine (R)-S-oxide reductase MsrB n=1 Tax=Sediminicola sp. YIK13 TaxID=1453352 RepID=UPI00071EB4AF|nr:peptide-methionine (R)-S-oxide reductase MsrB [Sediminicola sp. YIK13]ALM06689.1 peptide methionine sulfoxide reductase [Sediminicola sp. YIK13]
MIKNIVLIFCIVLTGCKGNSQEKKQATNSGTENFSIVKSQEEWKKELTDMQYYVLREAGTERAFTSDLLKEKREGTYVCAACGTPLFKSEHKFDSGTGWPSFDRAIEGNVAYDVDYKIGYKRTEEHCAVCGGHLGHVFEDGPRETTGERHCINGTAMKFVPAK